MGLRALIFTGLLFLFFAESFSQDYFSYGNSNFGGLNQVFANPASIADNRLKLDVIVSGIDLNFNNSWLGIKREALKNSGTLTKPVLPVTWKNSTPNVPDNVYKNFNVIEQTKKRAAIVEARVLLPSVLYQLDQKNALAFTWSVRQVSNLDGISQPFAYLFEKELDLNVTQNNRVQNNRLSAVQMSWAEYGFTYARVLKDKHQHFIKAGITPKLLQGLESMYLIVKDLDFFLSSKDSSSYFNMDFEYAHSANFNKDRSYKYVSKPGLGLDLGIVYEWRPEHQSYKYKADGKHYTWRKDLNKYKVKFGAALVDVGKIKFEKQGSSYDLNVNLKKDNVIKLTTLNGFPAFDSLLRADFSNQNQSNEYSILLPTALNTQLDYSINQLFYLNLSAHLADFFKSNPYRVHNYSSVCFAPRIEHYWFDVSVPFTYNVLSARRSKYLMTGLNLRAGPLSFGTSDLIPLFKGDVSSFNFYAVLKVSIPYKHIKDQDGDGVIDSKDKCPDEPGETMLNGCPDKDHDNITDKEDACPHQPGLAVFRGCPDTDGDGIKDGEDQCPTEKGSPALKGCPDKDGDLVVDKEDACPDVAGPKDLKGCPDTDKDGILDKDDECPTIKGILKYKGCLNRDGDFFHDGIDPCPDVAGPLENLGCPWPDTDKDGIIDKEDSCATIAGVAEYKGCPAPIKLAPAEKRILQKAFSSLEFESGKDIIKATSLPSLNALAKLLSTHKNDWQIKLSGHTDNEGSEESNMILSEKRAKAVQNYLVKRSVPQSNIQVEWFGQTRPVADNGTKDGKKKNRRVEMSVLMKMD